MHSKHPVAIKTDPTTVSDFFAEIAEISVGRIKVSDKEGLEKL